MGVREGFSNLQQQGEWAELQFMAAAARRHFTVCKPWGGTSAYDVGVDHGPNFLRVQVKSSTCRRGRGYWCQFVPHAGKEQDYSLEQVDLFAAYVIPENAWYLIPAARLLGRERKRGAMLFPVELPVRKNSFHYEGFKDAWWLLRKTRLALSRCGEQH
jgi:PD-(D/E)XK endonuclease